jgi:hypothetical protein
MTFFQKNYDKDEKDWQEFNKLMDSLERGPNGRFTISKTELDDAAQETLNLMRRLRAHPAAEEAVKQLLLNINIKKGWL